jgi:hypothetical protein
VSEPDEPLRPQLDVAIARVRRELEILESPSSIGGRPDDGGVIAALQKELAELEDARAGLGPYER